MTKMQRASAPGMTTRGSGRDVVSITDAMAFHMEAALEAVVLAIVSANGNGNEQLRCDIAMQALLGRYKRSSRIGPSEGPTSKQQVTEDADALRRRRVVQDAICALNRAGVRTCESPAGFGTPQQHEDEARTPVRA